MTEKEVKALQELIENKGNCATIQCKHCYFNNLENKGRLCNKIVNLTIRKDEDISIESAFLREAKKILFLYFLEEMLK